MKKYLPILLMLSASGAFAALNKWVDEDGKVHYSDQPPPANVKSEVLRSTTGTPEPAAASEPAAAKTIVEREAELKKAQQAKKEAADKAALEQKEEEAMKANCLAYQQNLRALEEGMRLVDVDASGERSYVDDEERQRRIAKAQEGIAKWCK
jgi:hypothetical protein